MKSYSCQNTAALLFALQYCPGKAKVKRFTHDYIPLIFFSMGRRRLQNLGFSFQYLTVLHLVAPYDTIAYDGTDKKGTLKNAWAKAYQGIANVLLSAPNLEDLRFVLDSMRMNWHDNSFEYANWQSRECRLSNMYVTLWKLFGGHTWTKLRKLRIEGFVVCEDGLYDFLARFAPTLKCLELKDIALWQGRN